MDELKALRSSSTKSQHGNTGGKGSGGKGKSKAKDQTGAPLCFSWAAGTGACGTYPSAECVWPIKRIHNVANA